MTTLATTAPANLSIDPKGVDALRQSAKNNSPDAIKGVAQQFEGLFMSMIMKSMREATPKEGLFDSEQGKMFSSMLDQQLSQNLAKRGVGLADMLIRQLSGKQGSQNAVAETGSAAPSNGVNGLINSNTGLKAPALGTALSSTVPAQPGAGLLNSSSASAFGNSAAIGGGFQANLQTALESGIPGVLKAVLNGKGIVETAGAMAGGTAGAIAGVVNRVAASSDPEPRVRTAQAAHVRAFEDKLRAHAEDASRSTGIPAKFMLGQAALESGWGKREIVAADGTNSHNVFAIKANTSWKGKTVETATTEYVNGVPERKIERFRAYDNYGDAFRDYAKLLQNNPRYQNVLANSQDAQSFAQGLQRAGYATDPQYAAKLSRIISHSLST